MQRERERERGAYIHTHASKRGRAVGECLFRRDNKRHCAGARKCTSDAVVADFAGDKRATKRELPSAGGEARAAAKIRSLFLSGDRSIDLSQATGVAGNIENSETCARTRDISQSD